MTIKCMMCAKEYPDLGHGELLGLTVQGFWAGKAGGGPVPKTWICEDCVVNSVGFSALVSDAMMGD